MEAAMIEELRRQAGDAAQDAMRQLITGRITTGKWNDYLAARYYAAERLVDMIDEVIQSEQIADPGAPDYFGRYSSESEARLMDGNR
jgi:hypothetical protein